MRSRAWDGEPVDFLDGVVFSRDEIYLTLGRWADAADARQADPSDYTGPAGLLPVDAAARAGRPHRPRLPLAVGHRLVLVLAGLRGAAAGRPPALAQEQAAQRRLLEDRRLREPSPRHGSTRRPPWQTASRARRAGRRDPAGPYRRVPRLVPPRGAHRTGLAVPDPAAPGPRVPYDPGETPWPLYPMEQGQPYVNVGFWSTVPIDARARRTATSTGPSRTRSTGSVATSRSTPTPTTTSPPSTASTVVPSTAR